MITMNASKDSKKPKESPLKDLHPVVAEEKKRFVFEIDKSHPLEWVAYEHVVVNNVLVKTTVLSKDIKQITKRKLEIRMFTGE